MNRKALVPVKHAEFYAKVWKLRAKGMQPSSIAAKLGVLETRVIKALNYLIDRYGDILGKIGKDRILAEHAMAIETTMIAISDLCKKDTKADVRLQAIKLREELRKDWLNALAQAGVVKFERVSFSESVTDGMTNEQKLKLAKRGMKLLREKARDAAKEDGTVETRIPGEAGPH